MAYNLNSINKEALLILYVDDSGMFHIDYFPIEIDTKILDKFSKLKESLSKTSKELSLTSLQKYELKKQMVLDYWNEIINYHKYLIGYRSYCYNISSSHISSPIPIFYNSKFEILPYKENSDAIELKLDNNPIELESIFSERFFYSYFFEKTYDRCNFQEHIKAFSHRRLGWYSINFKLNNDFEIEINTNFGFGYANYFCVTLIYEGIKIIPYSRLVRYFYANVSQLIRHTWEFRINEKNWHIAFTKVRDACNGFKTTDKQNFINKYFLNELDSLTYLLNTYLNKNEFSLSENLYGDYSESNDENFKNVKLDGFELTLFRTEKVSGAIGFIESIQKISKFSSIEKYIKVIRDCCVKALPEIDNAVIQIGLIINELEKCYKMESEKMEILNIDYQEYFLIWERLSKIENDRLFKILELNKMNKSIRNEQYNILKEIVENQMNIDYPDWPQINEIFYKKKKAKTDQTNICFNLNNQISKYNSNLTQLIKNQKIIYDYLENN